MAVLLIAGIGFVLAGLLGIVFGLPVKEFSFGNTLILTGAVTVCTGAILLGLWMVIRELKNIAGQLGRGVVTSRDGAARSTGPSGAPANKAREDGSFPFGRDPRSEDAGDAEPGALPPAASSPMPWHAEAKSRDRGRSQVPDVPVPVEAEPAAKPRRNLLFASSMRKDRERAKTRDADQPSATDVPAEPPFEPAEAPPARLENGWPKKSERAQAVDAPLSRRSTRVPSTFTDRRGVSADPNPPVPPNEDASPVIVVKSGVVDGMAYSLYSDGSIEAQMPEGLMRFSSIDELRSYLDQRT